MEKVAGNGVDQLAQSWRARAEARREAQRVALWRDAGASGRVQRCNRLRAGRRWGPGYARLSGGRRWKKGWPWRHSAEAKQLEQWKRARADAELRRRQRASFWRFAAAGVDCWQVKSTPKAANGLPFPPD